MPENYIELSPDLAFLIVDESMASRDSLAECLRKLGYRKIFQAHDGFAGLAVLRREKIGFVIADKALQPISGIEFLKEIRENPAFYRVPFILMATEITKNDIIFAAEYNVDAYLEKPFVLKDVSKRISVSMATYLGANNIERTFDYAREKYLLNDHNEAINTYKRIIVAIPTSARARVGLGRCFRAQRLFKEAEEILLDAADLNKSHVHAYHELGLTYLDWGQEAKAIKFFTKAIEISPKNPIRYETVATILLRASRYADAEDFLQKALKIGLNYPVLVEQLGKALFFQNKRDKALQYYLRALRQEPQNVSFLNSIAICMKEMGRFEDALTYYNYALKQTPGDVRLLFNKALCLLQMKEPERARLVLVKILQVNPGYEKAISKLKAIDQELAKHKANGVVVGSLSTDGTGNPPEGGLGKGKT